MSGLTAELVVSRSVRDTAAVLEWVVRPARRASPTWRPPGPAPTSRRWARIRAGSGSASAPRRPAASSTSHPECVAAAEETGRLLESLGHSVEQAYPAVLDDERLHPAVPRALERAAWTGTSGYWADRTGREIGPQDVEPLTWALAEMGRSHTAGEYLRAVEYAPGGRPARRRAGGPAASTSCSRPRSSLPPLPLGSYERRLGEPADADRHGHAVAVFTAGINTTGQPAISLPLHTSVEGLPIGVQLVAAYGARGPAPAGGLAAGGGRPVGRPPPADLRGRAGYGLEASARSRPSRLLPLKLLTPGRARRAGQRPVPSSSPARSQGLMPRAGRGRRCACRGGTARSRRRWPLPPAAGGAAAHLDARRATGAACRCGSRWTGYLPSAGGIRSGGGRASAVPP